MSQRLPDSKRNELIANYMEGKEDPEYEVIPNKNTKGKYTVRKRKVNLPVEKEEPQVEIESKEETKESEPEQDQKESLEQGQYFNPYNPYMFQDYQMMMNKMLVEQMKLMRQQMKYQNKKREKLKTKSKKIYDLLYDLAKPKEVNHEEEEINEEPEKIEPPRQPIKEENHTNYFESDYKNKEPSKPKPEPDSDSEHEPEQPQYKQEYEAKIDQMGGFIRMPSRRDRLNFKNFNI